MTNPLPRPGPEPQRPEPRPTANAPTPVAAHDWRLMLGAHWRWWRHRRRVLWKQTAAAVLVTAVTLLLWLALVEVLD